MKKVKVTKKSTAAVSKKQTRPAAARKQSTSKKQKALNTTIMNNDIGNGNVVSENPQTAANAFGNPVAVTPMDRMTSGMQSQIMLSLKDANLSTNTSEDSLGNPVADLVKIQVFAQMKAQLSHFFVSPEDANDAAKIDAAWDAIIPGIWRKTKKDLWNHANEGFYNYRGGVFWAGWCAHVSFIRDVLGLKDSAVNERFAVDETLCLNCGWVWWHENVLAVSCRPRELHRDEQGRLHNLEGPSIAYRDGWSLWHSHGVSITEQIVLRPETMTVEQIDKETNAEVRRVMIEQFTQERYLIEGKAKEIHKDDFGTLYFKEVPGDEAIVMVKVVNSTQEPDGSFRDYFLRVPPGMKRAKEAVAWTFDMSEEEYAFDAQT